MWDNYKSKGIKSFCATLTDASTSPVQVASAGWQIFDKMCEGKTTNTLDSIRYIMYIQYRRRNYSLKVSNWIVTYSLRIPLQSYHLEDIAIANSILEAGVGKWERVFSPSSYRSSSCFRETTEFVRCKCKISSKSPCNTYSCSCRKHGLTCLTACRILEAPVARTLVWLYKKKTNGNTM